MLVWPDCGSNSLEGISYLDLSFTTCFVPLRLVYTKTLIFLFMCRMIIWYFINTVRYFLHHTTVHYRTVQVYPTP
jgi:hypothetical protein